MKPIDPNRVLRRFVEQGVTFAVIGGHAVNHYGYPRSTQDVDLIVGRSQESNDALYRVLTEINAYWISDEVDPATGIERTIPITRHYIESTRLMMLGSDEGYWDLFDFIPGMPDQSVEDVLASVVVTESIPYANLAWLRRMKEASGRAQDLIDLENLPET